MNSGAALLDGVPTFSIVSGVLYLYCNYSVMSVTKWNGDTMSIEVSYSVCNDIRHEQYH